MAPVLSPKDEAGWTTDTVPPAIRKRMDLMDFEPAVKLLHYPPADVDEHALGEKNSPPSA